MSKPVKGMISRELATRYADVNNAVWIEMSGIGGIATNDFRRELRSREMRLEVVKTAMFRQACADGPLAPLAQALTGPVALVTGGGSAIDVAKLLDEWKPRFPKETLKLRGAVLEGEYLDEQSVQGLSRMASRADLQAQVVTIVLTPGRNVVAAALSPGRKVLGCVKALIEKLEKGEEIKKTA